MAKKILLPGDTAAIPDQEVCENVPAVKDVKACGSVVVVEVLTPNELMNTKLHLGTKPNENLNIPLQGYVRAIGPGVKMDDWGFKVGDRVVISGKGVMVPNYDGGHRDRFFIDPNAIRGVLVEG